MTQKQFIGVAKAIPTQHGEMLKHSFPIDEMEKLIEQQKAKGENWINIMFGKRREVSEKGYTHSAWLDEYKPDNSRPQNSGNNYEPDDQEPPF